MKNFVILLSFLFIAQNSQALPRCYLTHDYPGKSDSYSSNLGYLTPSSALGELSLTVDNITATVATDNNLGYITWMEIDDNSTGAKSVVSSDWDANSGGSTISLFQKSAIYNLICGLDAGNNH
jgi:hypothetical protein